MYRHRCSKLKCGEREFFWGLGVAGEGSAVVTFPTAHSHGINSDNFLGGGSSVRSARNTQKDSGTLLACGGLSALRALAYGVGNGNAGVVYVNVL